MKTILYNFWGYLSDRINVSAPDGNASYSSWIINEVVDRGFEVYGPSIDRDLKDIINIHGLHKSFAGFAHDKRIKAYKALKFTGIDNLPSNLDYLLLEWRFETIYNTLDKTDKNFCPDLLIQNTLLEKYMNTKTKIIILDLDYKLTKEDIDKIQPYKILEQGIKPKFGTCISLGVDPEVLFEILPKTKIKDFSYVGNEYEREDDIANNLDKYSKYYPNMVHFYGNWPREDKKWFRDKYPNISYHDRIGLGEFGDAMSDSYVVPLLAKQEYKDNGFMTFRFVEALMFGTLPVGYNNFFGIEKYLPDELIIDDGNFQSSNNVINKLKIENKKYYSELRRYLIEEKVNKYFNIKNFIDEVL